MYLTLHGHFYQPPREDPWTGKIPVQPGASPHHDWNERISAQSYAPNARSRILDDQGRIEEIVNNYDWIHFDFGPTLLRWIESEDPGLYAEILAADTRSRARFGGHGNAIAQAYNHMILPLANERDKRTQVIWGLRDFEHRFGRASESVWLPETAVDLDTLRILIEHGLRYLILAPGQARRVRPIAGGAWKDVSGGRIDPRRAYRWILPDDPDGARGIDLFFYDGPLSVGISFEHLLRNASTFADRIQAVARGAGEGALVHAATDGEVYGHHEPFGDMCLAYLIAREGRLRGTRFTNYGAYLDAHPPRHQVEIDFGEAGEGTSWSCAHGVDRWKRDCGCTVGGPAEWNQKWRTPLRRGLDALRDRLADVFTGGTAELLVDPWAARDAYIDVLLDSSRKAAFLQKHARRALSDAETRRVWRLIESQHNAMLMFTSCAWFFDDVSGIEVQQNLAYAARACELAQPFASRDLEAGLLDSLHAARSNIREQGTAADVYRRHVRPLRRPMSQVAIEAAALVAAGQNGPEASTPAFEVSHLAPPAGAQDGTREDGFWSGTLVVRDRRTEEIASFVFRVERDPEALLTMLVRDVGTSEEITRHVDDLPEEIRLKVVQTLLADHQVRAQESLERIFGEARPLMERYHALGLALPPIYLALAGDVIRRRCEQAADALADATAAEMSGDRIRSIVAELSALADPIGISLDLDPVARIIDRTLDDCLRKEREPSSDAIRRALELVTTCGAIGVPIRRTTLEENVYALLGRHEDAIVHRLNGRTMPASGVDPDVLIALAEQSNLSLAPWKKTPATSA
jgi:hypothetical protein